MAGRSIRAVKGREGPQVPTMAGVARFCEKSVVPLPPPSSPLEKLQKAADELSKIKGAIATKRFRNIVKILYTLYIFQTMCKLEISN